MGHNNVDHSESKWKSISMKEDLSHTFIYTHKNNLDFDILSEFYKFPDWMINKLEDYVNWHNIAVYQNVSLEFLCDHQKRFTWEDISSDKNLSIARIIELAPCLKWGILSKTMSIPEDIIEGVYEYIDDLEAICIYQKLSGAFIEKHWKDLWRYNYEICRYQQLSPKFMRDNKDILRWDVISECQKLSMNFIEEMKDYVNWDWISMKQELSPRFISRFSNRLNLMILVDRGIELPFDVSSKPIIDIYTANKAKNGGKIVWNLGITPN